MPSLPYQNLSDRIAEYIQYSRRGALTYNWIYRITRGLIIVLSALTAAFTKSGGQMSRLSELSPYFAVSVAILAALEAWLKPGVIYRAHYEFNDIYIDLESKLALIEPGDTAALKSFTEQLGQVDSRYRKAVQDR